MSDEPKQMPNVNPEYLDEYVQIIEETERRNLIHRDHYNNTKRLTDDELQANRKELQNLELRKKEILELSNKTVD
ncbi:hypothetical protein [Pleionea sediminis]|uniref:hypothetical protein n=1 Tax=Pleionea sediminis TaxID=2569479 RepID=UPI0011848D83|nr:hypothetical protein [Pleionea sediminis]